MCFFFQKEKSLTQLLILYFWWDFGSAVVYLIHYCSSLFGTHMPWNPHHSMMGISQNFLCWPFLFRISPLESWIQHKKHWLANEIFEIQTFYDFWNALVVLKKLGILFPSSASIRKQRWYHILSRCKAGGNLFLKPGSFIEKIEGCYQEYVKPCDQTVQQIKPPYKHSTPCDTCFRKWDETPLIYLLWDEIANTNLVQSLGEKVALPPDIHWPTTLWNKHHCSAATCRMWPISSCEK